MYFIVLAGAPFTTGGSVKSGAGRCAGHLPDKLNVAKRAVDRAGKELEDLDLPRIHLLNEVIAFNQDENQVGFQRYDLLDVWENPEKKCEVAFSPEHCLDRYFGAALKLG